MIASNSILSNINSDISCPSIRIMLAGGGTGGHIFPAIAIANAIRQRVPTADILFVGAKGKMEMVKVPEAGYNVIGLDIAGYSRGSLIKNFKLPFKLLKSFIQVRRILKSFNPSLIVGVGGYSSFPVLRLAQAKNIPTFIHESNSYPGKSNIILSKKAKKVFVAFEGMSQFFPSEKIIITGNPVRKIFSTYNVIRKEAVEYFGLRPDKKTVLVVGGSLGARSINQAIDKNLDFFRGNDLQLIWQTGNHFASTAARDAEESINVWCNEFIDKIEYAYVAADIVVSRAGAMAVAELAIVGKPVIFIPYPYASEDHQTSNALALVNKKAALIIRDEEVSVKLISAIKSLINDDALCLELKNNILKFSNTTADEVIAAEVLKYIK